MNIDRTDAAYSGMATVQEVESVYFQKIEYTEEQLSDIHDLRVALENLTANEFTHRAANAMCCAYLNRMFPMSWWTFNLDENRLPQGLIHANSEQRASLRSLMFGDK